MVMIRQFTARGQFLRDVGMVLTLQLLFLCVVTTIVMSLEDCQTIVRMDIDQGGPIHRIAFGTSILCYLSILYSDCEHACNVLSVAFLTAGLTYHLIYNLMSYDYMSIRSTIMLAMFSVAAVTFFAAVHLKFDLTRYHPIMMVVGWVGILIYFIFTVGKALISAIEFIAMPLYLLMCCILVVFFAFDVQTVMGDKYLIIASKDVIYGAARLFVDMVYIYLLIGTMMISRSIHYPT